MTTDVVEEFSSDGVVYLELRTTLRPLPTYRDYLLGVIEGVKSSPSVLTGRIVARLLISIDRARGVVNGQQAVTLAIEAARLWPELVMGVDLSGNPSVSISVSQCASFGTVLYFFIMKYDRTNPKFTIFTITYSW